MVLEHNQTIETMVYVYLYLFIPVGIFVPKVTPVSNIFVSAALNFSTWVSLINKILTVSANYAMIIELFLLVRGRSETEDTFVIKV